ncbi:helix-turn-helix domain-containing protein [uncultured Algibacter sp.]|uniref:helix-turn-helix domain-containing protein n=1 Tax=uncultured Algibacter sp. TaxID=298659 RepID=UPI00262AF2CB|nr:helix-turn-helix domain-containing protein [uncultured Algibacter sp.]
MANKIERGVIMEVLNRICTHNLFSNSPTHTELLTYLVEKTLNEEELNEVTIGSDLYRIDYSENKRNSTVRSYMYKLRKKLTEYYNEAGKNEPVVFEIIKGQYTISFIPIAKYAKSSNKAKASVIIPINYIKGIGTVLLLTLTTFFVVKVTHKKPSFIWKNYFEKNAPNLVVISDQYMVYEKLPNGKIYGISYPEINNHNDLFEYTQKHPDKKLKTTDYTLMSKMAPYTVKTLSHWFESYKNDFQLELESRLKYEDVQNHNILFVGQYKTMNLSKSLFLKDSKVFTTFNDGFKYKGNGTEKVYNTKFGDNQKVEYAMVSYTSLSTGKSALYFVSNNDIGVMATVKKFTDQNWLVEFRKQLHGESKHFNALFEVNGLQRNDVSCKLVELEHL